MGFTNVPLKSQDNDVLLLKLRARENLCFTLYNNFPITRQIVLVLVRGTMRRRSWNRAEQSIMETTQDVPPSILKSPSSIAWELYEIRKVQVFQNN